jgi:hypothetical protein
VPPLLLGDHGILPSSVVEVVLVDLIGQGGTWIDSRQALVLVDEVGIGMVSIRPFAEVGSGLVVWMVWRGLWR